MAKSQPEKVQATKVGEPETIALPLAAMRVALNVAADDDDRPSINGVYVHAVAGECRVVATDGATMLVHSIPGLKKLPKWLKAGVIIPSDGLKERLGLLERLKETTVKVTYAAEAPYVTLSDPIDACIFRMQPVDALYPEYQRTIDQLTTFEERSVTEMESEGYTASSLKEIAGLAKMLKAPSVQIFSGGVGKPSLVLFPENPNVAVIMVGRKEAPKQLGHGVRQMLSGAAAGTVSALRAHQTRWRERGGPQAEAKVAEYEERIAAFIKAANPGRALPAPEAQPEPQSAHPLIEALKTALAEPEPVADDPELVPLPDLAKQRRGLAKAAQRKDRTKFLADVNAVLNKEHGGLTVHQLADGVPIDDWYDAGETVEDAAKRCLDWRRAGTVLPPEDLDPSEVDLAIALVQSRPSRQAEEVAEAEESAAAEPEVTDPVVATPMVATQEEGPTEAGDDTPTEAEPDAPVAELETVAAEAAKATVDRARRAMAARSSNATKRNGKGRRRN